MDNTETKLSLIAKKAREEPNLKFTSLIQLLNVEYLTKCFHELKRGKAAGIDGRTWESCSTEEIEQAIEATVQKMKAKKYKPQPVRRVYNPKPNGRKRPLGIPTVIDKVVQYGISQILQSIYEADFLSLSYGYRPGKGAHEALKEVNHMIMGESQLDHRRRYPRFL